MKILRFLLIIVVILPFLGIKISAEDSAEKYISDFEEIIPEDVSDALGDGTLTEEIGIGRVARELVDAISGHRTEVISFFLMLIGICVLTALPSQLLGDMGEQAAASVGVVASIMIFTRLSSIFTSVTSSLAEISSFFSAFVPIGVGLLTLGGGVSAAGVQGSGMYLSLSLLDTVGTAFFTATSALGLSMSLISSFGGEGVEAISRRIKSLFTFGLGIFTTVFSATLGLQSVLASASDSAAMRAAKYAASGMIPVVGSAVSGALSTLSAGVGYAKSIVGVGACAVLLSLALSPLVLLLLYRLAFSTADIFAEFIGSTISRRVITSFRSSLDMIIALYSLSTIIYIFQLILFLKTEVALL